MDEFDRKVIAAFPGKSVRKDLTALMKKGANVPTYVLEYLLGMYCATDDEETIKVGLESREFSARIMFAPTKVTM